MTNRQLRAIVGARVSVVKGAEKVSHVAQHDSGVNYAERQGYEVVGAFEDLDVSAQVSPWDRSDLGQWLTDERAPEWDVMIFSKIDRAFRSIRDCVKLAEWMQQHNKVLIFSDDGLTLDYHSNKRDRDISSMMAELFVYLGAFFAEIELERFRGRSIAAHEALRTQTRWTGGIAPDGYLIVEHSEGRGKGLATDYERKKILNAMADLIIDGESFNGVADWLNAKEIPTNQDHQRPENERKGTAWSATEVINVLTTPATQGWKTTGAHKHAKVMLDDEGEPIRLAPPTFEEPRWNELQEAIQARKRAPYRTRKASPLSGVVYCWRCGKAASQNVHTKIGGKQYRYYRCCRTPKACPRVRVRAEIAEERLEQDFLEQCGHLPVPQWRFVPGADHTEELEQVRKRIAQQRDDREAGLIDGEEDEQRYRETMKKLLAKRKDLEEMPEQQQSGWIKEDTDETYNQAWQRLDSQGRRKLLIDSGILLWVEPNDEMTVQIPSDMLERIS